MKFDETTIRILVRKDYGECFDFYTEKIGLTAVWGDRNGPYTSFAVSSEASPCFAIFAGNAMPMFQGYEQPNTRMQPTQSPQSFLQKGLGWRLSAAEGGGRTVSR